MGWYPGICPFVSSSKNTSRRYRSTFYLKRANPRRRTALLLLPFAGEYGENDAKIKARMIAVNQQQEQVLDFSNDLNILGVSVKDTTVPSKIGLHTSILKNQAVKSFLIVSYPKMALVQCSLQKWKNSNIDDINNVRIIIIET